MESFSISNTARSYPALPYEDIKNAVCGKSFAVSLVFLGERRAQALNKSARNKSYTPNVLSFPITKSAGEVYITPQVAKREAKKFGHTYKKHVGYLYIHGLLHLIGHDHGAKMEKLEQKFIKQFNLL